MIRTLSESDLRLLVEGGLSFFDEGKMPGGFNPEVFIRTWERLISSGVGFIFGMFGPTGEIQGALAATVFPDMFNGDLTATENFWYVIPRFRGRGALLLRHFERWAKSLGCKRVHMIHLRRLQPERLRSFYESLGYEEIESCYTKELSTV